MSTEYETEDLNLAIIGQREKIKLFHPPDRSKFDKEVDYDRSFARYKKNLERVHLVFRHVLPEVYDPWPFITYANTLDIISKRNKAREEFKDQKEHPCHSDNYIPLECIQKDREITRSILRSCLVGAIGLAGFKEEMEDVGELIECLILNHMSALAVTAAFISQNLSEIESQS